jgi:TonB family protein
VQRATNGTRRHPRQLVTPRLYVSMNGSSAGGILYDLSVGGMSLDVVGPKPAGERVLLDFDLSETGEHFEGAGRIIWKSEGGNRVGIQFANLPEASHLKLRSWLAAKSISGSGSQNVVVQDRQEAMLMENPAWLRVRISAPTSSAMPKVPQVDQQAISDYIDSISPKAPALATSPAMPGAQSAAALAGTRGTLARAEVRSEPVRVESAERAERELRTAFFPLLVEKPLGDELRLPATPPRDWKRILQWTLSGAFVMASILLLGFLLWNSTSPEVDLGAQYQALKSGVERGFAKLLKAPVKESGPPRVPAASQNQISEPRPVPSKRATGESGAGALTSKSAPQDDRFEVMDAQHGKRYFPRTSTSVVVQFERPFRNGHAAKPGPKNESIPGITGVGPNTTSQPSGNSSMLLAPLANGLKSGRVLRESSGELPILETMPEYSMVALQSNVQGRVFLTAVINKDGTLKDVRLLSSPSVLDSPVLEAVRTWRYQPHYVNGEPVEVVTEIVVDFSITTK